MSAQTNNNNDNDNGTGDDNNKYKLIDVDCNLVHPDLMGLYPKFKNSATAEEEAEKHAETRTTTTINPIVLDCAIQLLHQTSKQGIVSAMLTPSSTLKEVEENLQLIDTYYNLYNNQQQQQQQQAEQEQQQEGDNNNNNNNNSNTMIQLLTTAGVHPYHASEAEPSVKDLQTLRNFFTTPKGNNNNDKNHNNNNNKNICAVGECGLDYSEGFPPAEHQLPWFRAQIKLAREFQLPLFIHERAAHDDLLQCLDEDDETKNTGGEEGKKEKIIIHCFTGTVEECREYVSRGYYFSVSGYICKNNNKNNKNSGNNENHNDNNNNNNDPVEQVRQCLVDGIIPLDKLMVETDAPYMGFEGCRNEFLETLDDHFDKTLNSKKRKRLLKSIYPNVPTALPQVLDQVVTCINQGRQARNNHNDNEDDKELEKLVTAQQVADITTRNAMDFFGFSSSPSL